MKAQLAGMLVLGLLATSSLYAHHPFSSEFDLKKPMTLNGTVSRVRWANPHTTVEITVTNTKGADGTWTLELDGASELDRIGWKRASLAVGDQIKAEGWIAKDGTHRLGAKVITMKSGRVLPATASFYEASATHEPVAQSGRK